MVRTVTGMHDVRYLLSIVVLLAVLVGLDPEGDEEIHHQLVVALRTIEPRR